MKKIDKLENFINLNKTDKKNLTISWLIELIKTEHLSIEDVIDILNNIEPTFSKVDKLECLLINGQISTSTILLGKRNSGIPYFNTPPISCNASNTVTS